jgi:hypothetical protein
VIFEVLNSNPILEAFGNSRTPNASALRIATPKGSLGEKIP